VLLNLHNDKSHEVLATSCQKYLRYLISKIELNAGFSNQTIHP